MALTYATKRSGFGAGIQNSRARDAAAVKAERTARADEADIAETQIGNAKGMNELEVHSLNTQRREEERRLAIKKSQSDQRNQQSLEDKTRNEQQLAAKKAQGEENRNSAEQQIQLDEQRIRATATKAQLKNQPQDIYNAQEEKRRKMYLPIWHAFQESINLKQDKATSYAFYRQQLVNTAGFNEQARKEFSDKLTTMGITPEYSETSYNLFGKKANLAIWTEKTSEQYLKDKEANYRAKLKADADTWAAKASIAKAKGLPVDMVPTEQQIDNVSGLMQLMSPKLYDALDGGRDNKTGVIEKGTVAHGVAVHIAGRANNALLHNKAGDPNISTVDVTNMLVDSTAKLASILTEDRGLWPKTVFNGPMYRRITSTLLADMDNLRRMTKYDGVAYDKIWNDHSDRLISRSIKSYDDQIEVLKRNQEVLDADTLAKEEAAKQAERMATGGDVDTAGAYDPGPGVTGNSNTASQNAEIEQVTGGMNAAKQEQARKVSSRKLAGVLAEKIGLRKTKAHRTKYKGDDVLKIMQYARTNMRGMNHLEKEAFITHFNKSLNANQRQIVKDLAGN